MRSGVSAEQVEMGQRGADDASKVEMNRAQRPSKPFERVRRPADLLLALFALALIATVLGLSAAAGSTLLFQAREAFLRSFNGLAAEQSRASCHLAEQVAASAVGDGTFAEVSRSSQVSPRTPAGPSERTRRRRPTSGSEYSAQKSAPVSSRTFCSTESRATRLRRSASSSVRGAIMGRAG